MNKKETTLQRSAQYRIRKIWTILVGMIVATLVLSGCGATATKVYRVGILSGLDFFANTADSFKAKMTELGYVEGQNIIYDVQKTNVDPAAESKILDKFVADQVDLIFVFPTEVSIAAKQAIQGTNIPVVFAQAFIEQGGLVNSVREPGGNITGVRFPGPDLAVKRFEVLLELMPKAKRLWVPYQKGYPNVPPQLEALRPVAAAAGVTLVEAPFATVAELQADLQARAKSVDIGMDAILMLAEPLTVTPDAFAVIGQFAAEHMLLVGGALMVVGDYSSVFGAMVDNVAVGNQAAPLADKILKGTTAGTIPVASAESFLKINYKAAQALNLTMPDGLLRQAVEVIR
jgi:putative tryptophan/tyrosine transport system substrate-binding protein